MAEAVVGEMRIPTKKAPKTRAGGVTMHARAFNISLSVAQTVTVFTVFTLVLIEVFRLHQ